MFNTSDTVRSLLSSDERDQLDRLAGICPDCGETAQPCECAREIAAHTAKLAGQCFCGCPTPCDTQDCIPF